VEASSGPGLEMGEMVEAICAMELSSAAAADEVEEDGAAEAEAGVLSPLLLPVVVAGGGGGGGGSFVAPAASMASLPIPELLPAAARGGSGGGGAESHLVRKSGRMLPRSDDGSMLLLLLLLLLLFSTMVGRGNSILVLVLFALCWLWVVGGGGHNGCDVQTIVSTCRHVESLNTRSFCSSEGYVGIQLLSQDKVVQTGHFLFSLRRCCVCLSVDCPSLPRGRVCRSTWSVGAPWVHKHQGKLLTDSTCTIHVA